MKSPWSTACRPPSFHFHADQLTPVCPGGGQERPGHFVCQTAQDEGSTKEVWLYVQRQSIVPSSVPPHGPHLIAWVVITGLLASPYLTLTVSVSPVCAQSL